MKVIVFGASGILGQHMRLCCPAGVESVYVRRSADRLHVGLDLNDSEARDVFLEREKPDVIVNLAGESNTDVVERNHGDTYYGINVMVPRSLAKWCENNGAHYVHVSTQAVFSGNNPPYKPMSEVFPQNEYGRQKVQAEKYVMQFDNWAIMRPTFVLGVRPLPHVGRANPIEQMFSGAQRKQVNDRWFSVSFAREVAASLWRMAIERTRGIIHIGSGRVSRYDIATGHLAEPVPHNSFPGIAARPIDTSYGGEIDRNAMEQCGADWRALTLMGLSQRAREIALFLGKPEDECLGRLNQGWASVHNAVSADWNVANPRTDEEILDWYRLTESYIWELSWYHADLGFNYSGMCSGIAERLKAEGAKRLLCIGDGIGDLTISLIRAGFDATYHDLAGSRTEAFAAFRSWMYLGAYMPTRLSSGWAPDLGTAEWDAIVSLDFLEHCKQLPLWAKSIFDSLRPGGFLMCQNAFAIGSGPEGSMPMHLAENDRYEKGWDPLLFGIGFTQASSNWYQKPK
jgi:dTDP-4-dehydrorhamnose reductase